MDPFFTGKPFVSTRPPTADEEATYRRFVWEHITLSCQEPSGAVPTQSGGTVTSFDHGGVTWQMGL
jgi:hypothetical protein